jgi:hypothetical protein
MPLDQTLGPCGWVRDDDEVGRVKDELRHAYGSLSFGEQDTSIRGTAKRLRDRGIFGTFPYLAEKAIRGELQPAFHQRRGTCVSQGTGRAMQDNWYHALAQQGEVGNPVEIAIEALYGASRVQIGKGKLGTGDGSTGAWAAMAAHDFGVPPRGVYGQYDLREPREDLSVKWGAPGVGTPAEVLAGGHGVLSKWWDVETVEDLIDVAAAGFAFAFCGGFTYGAKDQNGVARMNQAAAHCTEGLAWAVSIDGDDLIGGQQSWGPDRPKGPSLLQYKGGVQAMREGMCFVPAEDYFRQLKSGGEIWVPQFVQGQGYRTKGPGT